MHVWQGQIFWNEDEWQAIKAVAAGKAWPTPEFGTLLWATGSIPTSFAESHGWLPKDMGHSQCASG